SHFPAVSSFFSMNRFLSFVSRSLSVIVIHSFISSSPPQISLLYFLLFFIVFSLQFLTSPSLTPSQPRDGPPRISLASLSIPHLFSNASPPEMLLCCACGQRYSPHVPRAGTQFQIN
uniref:Uncharacterized protein n=1 Tax=Myripristis murdjan TaxID=586833 RepID=A0A667WNY8_9TELE